MATLSELIADRATAGARYAAAVAELKAAMIDLAGIELALANNRVGHPQPVASFGPFPDPIALRHPVYAPAVGGHWPSEATARGTEIIAGFTP